MPLTLTRWIAALFLVVGAMAGCGGGDEPTLAAASDVVKTADEPGATPFIRLLRFSGASLAQADSVRFTISPRLGRVSKAVDVTWSAQALQRRGYSGGGSLTVPVFGLYAGHTNQVTVEMRFTDGSVQTWSADVTTAAYADPHGIYDRPRIIKARTAGSALGFDFFAVKSVIAGPMIVDTDGEIRWVSPLAGDGISMALRDNAFIVGSQTAATFQRLELDGSVTSASLVGGNGYVNFHHNLDLGKVGLLGEMDTRVAGVSHIESTLAEFTTSGQVVREWDFAAIVGNHMRGGGDDPALFVRPGIDWFHMNAATYDPRDDSVIVSSRENFVIKVGYQTGEIIWILGDPSKYWYNFPSLRAKALTLEAGGLYPIGQHALSINPAGELLLFNNGLASVNQPAGAPVGENRTFSPVSAYTVDLATMTAREAWRFDNDRTILSTVCSSVYEAADRSMLIDYAVAEGMTKVRIVGLDPGRQVVFDFEYANTRRCDVGWNSILVPLQGMRLD